MYNYLLNAFVEVADCGSFSKAAERLYISSTAIMKQMNMLEKHLGLKLLIRTNHGIELTDAGKSIYKDAKFMIQYSEQSVQRAIKAQNRNRKVVRIGTSSLYPYQGLMQLWEQVSDLHSDFRLKVVPFAESTEQMYSCLGEKFDLVNGVFEAMQKQDICSFLKINETRFGIAMSRKHPLAKQESLRMEDLYGEHLMIMTPGNSPTNDRIRLEIEKEHPQIILEDAPQYYDIDTFNQCEENGNLLLTLEEWVNIHPSLVTVAFDVPYTIPYGIIYSKEPSEATREFLDVIDSVIAASS